MKRVYSRVYHEIRDDPKFAAVYSDDHALATWLRLLIAADMAWPASAEFAAGVRRPVVARLAAAGLVDVQANPKMFRMHGLDKERGMRAEAARSAADASWKDRGASTKPGADAMQTHSESNAQQSKAEQQQEKQQSKAQQQQGPTSTDDDDDAHLQAWYQATASPPSTKVLPWLDRLASEHGAQQVAAAIGAEHLADMTRTTLLSRVEMRLTTGGRKAERAAGEQRRKAQEEAAAAERARIEAMPPEQRAANLKRLRDELVKSGLMTAEAAGRYVNGEAYQVPKEGEANG
jgi:hypothetical protein